MGEPDLFDAQPDGRNDPRHPRWPRSFSPAELRRIDDQRFVDRARNERYAENKRRPLRRY